MRVVGEIVKVKCAVDEEMTHSMETGLPSKPQHRQ